MPLLLLLAGLLTTAAAAPAAPEQLRVNPAQIARAGIATTPALAALPAAGAEAAGNDQYLAGTVVAPGTALALASSALGGVVQQVHVASLQRVAAGAPLLTLFSQPWLELQREYLQLAAQARLAGAKLARDEALFGDGIIAAARLEESRSAAQLAGLAADERRQALRAAGLDAAAIGTLRAGRPLSPMLTVRAQYAGTVLELPVSPGQRIEAGAELARIGRDGPLWVELQASRQQLALIRVGDLLQAKGCGKLRVVAISPVVNGANQSALVRAEQTERDACLKINAYVEARLLRGAAAAAGAGGASGVAGTAGVAGTPGVVGTATPAGAVALPAAALVRRGADTFVFVKRGAGFAVVPVRATAAGADMVWAQGALAAGEPVAVRGIVALKGIWAGLGAETGTEPAAKTAAPTGGK
ncbi:efflux RND transporter periplasmic adaptor subunit [Rugamonas sp. DEMB1]|uniref:efflux RND transporter periplasmic adaptor subunit n=1 Tax=Rugamonas sp. DEMB1 TaxID=3039386 RepID=UPI00244AD90A|nr:efflux RND transporter periplasmic adaptor subunit [Rugamonas sp. DEMB1]WGG53325.1 efflux RND transporter periplasmic adaptor subunit [Rugamonas sp. DEMB1]